MTRFTFTCPLPAEDIARALAPVIWPGYVSAGCPRFEDAPDRWELSNSNDHKLYVLGGGDRYGYGDRYTDYDRVARVRAVVESLGGVIDAD